jgi:hypothetical protein
VEAVNCFFGKLAILLKMEVPSKMVKGIFFKKINIFGGIILMKS